MSRLTRAARWALLISAAVGSFAGVIAAVVFG